MLTVETCATLAEAAGRIGERARYLAGGTLVMRAVNYGDQGFDRIVRARENLRDISAEGQGVRVGAGATMADVLAVRDLATLHPVARVIGGPAIRNMGTVGGNLFAAAPYGDFTTALLALDAQVVMTGGQTESIESFLAGRARTRGLVAAVIVPRVAAGELRFAKIARVKPKGVSMMAIAVHLPGGRSTGARIAFNGMGATPLRAKAAERALSGAALDTAGVAAALAVCCEGLDPRTDELATEWYRRAVAPVHLARLLTGGGG